MDYLFPHYEEELINELGYSRIIGIDEVGRGSWAGPVAVGAYCYTSKSKFLEGVQDSKKLKAIYREGLLSRVNQSEYSVWYATPEEIDFFGIGNALENLILKVINHYQDSKTFFLIDGRFNSDFVVNSQKIIGGDSKYYAIGLASIAAKVERDLLMSGVHKSYSEFGFDSHKGYGTKLHAESIKKHGIVEGIHRLSYKPIALEYNKNNLYFKK